jgi:hypothetical protein
MAKEQKDQLSQKLRKWLEEIGDELGDLLSGRVIFRRLKEIVKSNENIQSPAILHNWIADNYVAKMCTGIRKIVDKKESVSLYRLILQIKKNPDVITRDYFISQSKDEFGKKMGTAGKGFDKFAKPHEQRVDSERLNNDLQKLKEGTRLIKDFTDQWIAHWDENRDNVQMPTFVDLDKALDVIDKVWCDYSLLLKCHAPISGTCKPTIGDDWEAPLRHPWIKSPEQ